MKRIFIVLSSAFIFLISITQFAHADLDNFLSDLNNQAIADINHFNSTLSAQFKVPLPNVQEILKTVKKPADAFMCFQLSQMTGVHIEKVVKTYQRNSGKGWGVIAKELGIKPGSSSFYALKKGDFVFDGNQKVKKNKREKKEKVKNKGKKNK